MLTAAEAVVHGFTPTTMPPTSHFPQERMASTQRWPSGSFGMGNTRPRAASVASTCTLTGDDEDDEIVEQELIDLTLDDSDDIHHDTLSEGEVSLNRLDLRTGRIRVGDFIQVANATMGNYKIEFLIVKVLLRSVEGHDIARGIPFARTRCMFGKLPKKLNEVCMIRHFNEPALSKDQMPAIIDVLASDIAGTRSFIVTNALYPTHNPKHTMFAGFGDQAARMIAIEEHGTLVCRWKLEVYKLSTCRQNKRHEEIISRMLPEDVPDQQYRVDEAGIRHTWRGETAKGGSWIPQSHQSSSTLEGSHADGQKARSCGQKYTLFDSFSGAGGVSRGADMAGFRVQYGLDKSPDVWETYQANFPHASLFMESVDALIKRTTSHRLKVDVLHLSPPCQPFSPAHTRAAAHDDENIFALMGCFSLIRITRPRIVTLEQTFGITHDRHGEYMRVLINDFTAQGFSLRWQIVRLATWGSAQDRKRLILIAAAPGERLPPFPKPTHSEDGMGGLKPYNTISKVLRQVKVGDDLHDLEKARRHNPPRAPFCGDQLTGTITTSPGGFYHPSGTRDLTLREYAALQGFPKHHTFIGTRTGILRQIGNAFPPNTVRNLYKHIEKWLLEQDGMTAYQPRASEVVLVDGGSTLPNQQSRQRRFAPLPRRPAARGAVDVDMMDVCEPGRALVIDLT